MASNYKVKHNEQDKNVVKLYNEVNVNENPSREQLLQEIEKPQYYNNRELSWLAFNARVLEEAEDEKNPSIK